MAASPPEASDAASVGTPEAAPAAPAAATDVAVSIVNTSNRELLLACLASLQPAVDAAAAGTGPALAVVVLDNASEDGSAAAVRERFPWATVVEQPFRDGFGANHNAVLRSTTSRYAYILNEDTTHAASGIAALVAYLDAHPEVGAAAPRIRHPDGREQASAWAFPTPTRALVGLATLGQRGIVQSTGGGARPVDWLMGCALMVRRDALDRIGLFDGRFFMSSEETDLQRRLADVGYERHLVPAVEVVHHEKASSAAVPERQIVEAWRSRHAYWRKHHGAAPARSAAIAAGLQYAALAGVATATTLVGERLPAGRGPRRGALAPAALALHARCALLGPGPDGMRERADDWNREHGALAG